MSQPRITPEIAEQRYLDLSVPAKVDWILEQIDIQSGKRDHEPKFIIPKCKAYPDVIKGLQKLKWRVMQVSAYNPADDYYFVTWEPKVPTKDNVSEVKN